MVASTAPTEEEQLAKDLKTATADYKHAFETFLSHYSLDVDDDFSEQLDAAFKALDELSSSFTSWNEAAVATIDADMNLDLG